MLEFKYLNHNIINFLIIRRFRRTCCPHCTSNHIVLYGKSNMKQRYLCKDCRRTFSDFTNTPFAYAHFPEKLIAFMECTIKGMSLRDSGKELKVSYVTLFYWRHKLLTSLKELSPSKMQDTVEMENFYINYSQKGQKYSGSKERVHAKSMSYFNIGSDKVCVLTAMDFFQNIFSKAVCRGYINNTRIQSSVITFLNSNNIVCSRRITVFRAFLRKMNIKESESTLTVNSSVLKYIKDLNGWMERFNGVATKYLNNYLGWYKFLICGNFQDALSGVESMIDVVLSINNKGTYISVANEALCF